MLYFRPTFKRGYLNFGIALYINTITGYEQRSQTGSSPRFAIERSS